MNEVISIIIPVYNRPTLVAEAIDSVLAQTNPNWELIVVDDGSTDNTWEVLESYAEKDERIRIFKRDREPKGANRCRNMGAEMARTDYLFFLDSDDLIAETFVETRKRYIELFPEMDFIVFPEATFITRPQDGWWYEKKLFGDDGDLKRFFRRDTSWLTSGPIWKKRAFFTTKGFLEGLSCGQDWDIHIRAFLLKLSYTKIDLLKNSDTFKRASKDVPSISNTNSYKKLICGKVLIFNNLMNQNEIKDIIRKSKDVRKFFLGHFIWVGIELRKLNEIKDSEIIFYKLYKNKLISRVDLYFWKMFFNDKLRKKIILDRLINTMSYRLFKRMI